MRVLYVDDIEGNRVVMKHMLAAADVEMIEAENGQLGLDLINGDVHIDLILMDIRMPVMDGITATSLIRALPSCKSNTPIIVVTAEAGSDLVAECTAVGADGFMTKPVGMDQLFQTIAGYHCFGAIRDGSGLARYLPAG